MEDDAKEGNIIDMHGKRNNYYFTMLSRGIHIKRFLHGKLINLNNMCGLNDY